jgi:DNA mismatch endonuclease, patch repair protein
VTHNTRNELMARISSKNTKPEIRVRRALHSRGFRFRLHRIDLPGKPDIVLPKWNLAIFVNGCFWHQHPGCTLASKPKTNTEYWGPKLVRNVKRDQRNRAALRRAGWRVAVIWECQTRDARLFEKNIRRLCSLLRPDRQPAEL